MLISAAELADLRATAAEFLDQQATIFNRTASASDDHGGRTAAFTEGATVACRLDLQGMKPTGKDTPEGASAGQTEVFHLSLPLETIIGEADEVFINGIRYAVVSALDARSWAALLRVLVKRIVI